MVVASERGWAKSAKPRASCPHFKMQEEMELKLEDLGICRMFHCFVVGKRHQFPAMTQLFMIAQVHMSPPILDRFCTGSA